MDRKPVKEKEKSNGCCKALSFVVSIYVMDRKTTKMKLVFQKAIHAYCAHGNVPCRNPKNTEPQRQDNVTINLDHNIYGI